MPFFKLALAIVAARALKKLWVARKNRARRQACSQEKAIVPYAPLSHDMEEVPALEIRPLGWIFTFRSPHDDCANIYRVNRNKIVVELQGDAVAVIATPHTQDYMVEHGVALCLPEVPGLTVAFTTLETLEYVSGGGEVAWEISQGGHGVDDLETYLLEAIYHKCGYWVPLSIIRLS